MLYAFNSLKIQIFINNFLSVITASICFVRKMRVDSAKLKFYDDIVFNGQLLVLEHCNIFEYHFAVTLQHTTNGKNFLKALF